MLGGPERRSRVMTDREKLITAYHEAGHAIVAQAMPEADPVQKVTIIPRGMAGGYTLMIPEEDRKYSSVAMYEAQLAMALGGRVAEEIVFGEITNGASGDISTVTKIARAMITRFGMSPRLGPVALGQKDELIFLGREISEQRNYGEEVAKLIDEEVRRLVFEAYERSKTILTKYRSVLDDMSNALIELETLEGERLRELMERIPRGSFQYNGRDRSFSLQNTLQT